MKTASRTRARPLGRGVSNLSTIGEGTVRDIGASLKELVRVTRAASGAVHLIDESGAWTPVAVDGMKLPRFELASFEVKSPKPARTLARGQTLVVPDLDGATGLDAGLRGQIRTAGIRSFTSMPIVVHGRMLGTVAISDRRPRDWSEAEMRYLRFCARHIGLVLESAERLEESNERIRALAAISEVSALVAESLELNEVLRRIANNAQRVVGTSHAHVLLLDERSGALCGAAASPPWERRILRVRIEPRENGLGHIAMRTGRPVAVEDTRTHPGTNARLRRLFGSRAVLIVPLIVARRPLGVLATIDMRNPREFSARTVERLETLAHHAAAAIHNARLHEELRAREHELKILSDRIADAHETERRRIARELHDVVGQALAAIGLELAMADRGAATGGRLESARRMVRETAQAARRLSAELHPGILDDLGLVPALRWYCGEFSRRSGLRIALDAAEVPELAPAAAVVFYRAAQEGLSNVLRHAEAKFVSISLRRAGALVRLEVRDDGRGIVPAGRRKRPGVGLLAIRERTSALGGSTRLEPAAGGGAQLVLELPLSRAKPPVGESSAQPAR